MPFQKTFTLGSKRKGCHLVTQEVVSAIQDGLRDTQIGILHLFIQHTSAAITINENCDPDVRTDMDMALDRIVPEDQAWLHTDEGPDDSSRVTHKDFFDWSVSVYSNYEWQVSIGNMARYIPHRIQAYVPSTNAGGDNFAINAKKCRKFRAISIQNEQQCSLFSQLIKVYQR